MIFNYSTGGGPADCLAGGGSIGVNMDFMNPVNQRGFASGTAYTLPGAYFLDGWLVSGTATWTRGVGVKLAASAWFGQRFEIDYLELLGQAYTVSAEVGGEVKSVTINWPSAVNGASASGTGTLPGVGSVELGLAYVSGGVLINGVTQYYRPTLGVFSTAEVTIKRVKVERGQTSTLALDAPADYGTELAKCKRYYQKIELFPVAYTTSSNYIMAIGAPYCAMRLPSPSFSSAKFYTMSCSLLSYTASSVGFSGGDHINSIALNQTPSTNANGFASIILDASL